MHTSWTIYHRILPGNLLASILRSSNPRQANWNYSSTETRDQQRTGLVAGLLDLNLIQVKDWVNLIDSPHALTAEKIDTILFFNLAVLMPFDGTQIICPIPYIPCFTSYYSTEAGEQFTAALFGWLSKHCLLGPSGSRNWRSIWCYNNARELYWLAGEGLADLN